MHPLLFLLFFWHQQFNGFNLAKDLEKDKAMLREHGVWIDSREKYKLNIFDTYARQKLSGFKFIKKKFGNHVISQWQLSGKRKLTIYQVESVIRVDSIFRVMYIDTAYSTGGDKYHIKTSWIYHTYIINDSNKPELIYITELKEGLNEYRIGKRSVSPVREDIALGLVLPSLKEIQSLIHLNFK